MGCKYVLSLGGSLRLVFGLTHANLEQNWFLSFPLCGSEAGGVASDVIRNESWSWFVAPQP
jgi:hypothetical protein